MRKNLGPGVTEACSKKEIGEFSVLFKLEKENFPNLAPIRGFATSIAKYVVECIHRQDLVKYLSKKVSSVKINDKIYTPTIYEIETYFYKSFANLHNHFKSQIKEILAVLATILVSLAGKSDNKKIFEEFIKEIDEKWDARITKKVQEKVDLEQKSVSEEEGQKFRGLFVNPDYRLST